MPNDSAEPAPPISPSQDPLELITLAKQRLGEGRLSVLPEALALAESAVAILSARPEDPLTRRDLAEALLTQANALRETGTAAGRVSALPIYKDAIAHLEAVLDRTQPVPCNDLANAWTQLGMSLLDDDARESLEEAGRCFQKAIDLRDGLPLDEEPLFRWGLCAAWMNRADVLTRLGGQEALAEALGAYEVAIRHIQQLPISRHPSYLARYALAWMNSGITHRALDSGEGLQRAVECFGKSIELLTSEGGPADEEQKRILACSYMNRSNTLLAFTPERPREAREDAISALHLMAGFEERELLSAQLGLQARHLLCRATAYLADAGAATADWVTETTDAVDEGMALTRHWRQLGEHRLEPLACELFHFGCLVYRLCLPQFLTEFLMESLDPAESPSAPAELMEMHHIATEALWSAAADVRKREQAGTPAERMITLIEDLQEAEVQLSKLRGKYVLSTPAPAPAGIV